jgi:hypothetical protein
MWFAAHVIMYFKLKKSRPGGILVWENVFLVEAASAREANEKARRLGQAEEGDSGGTLRVNGRSAALTFGGVRKVVEVQGPVDRQAEGPVDGAEATYSVLEVKDRRALNRLIAGQPVTVFHRE